MVTPVRLYRMISVPEYDDLRAKRAFRAVGGAEGKYFWKTWRDASRFGLETEHHYHPDGYRVVAADVPGDIAARALPFAMLDGIGPALFIDLHDLTPCEVVFLDTP